MHALGRYIQELMDARGWKQADLVRASGLSRALVSRLVTKDTLGRMVEENSTIAGLARAFPEVGEEAFITKSAEALGVPVDRLVVVDASMERISNRALLDLLAQRLGESTSERGGTNDKSSAAQQKIGNSPDAGTQPVDIQDILRQSHGGFRRAAANKGELIDDREAEAEPDDFNQDPGE